MQKHKNWCVYIVECFDKTLYTGITTDPERRVIEHNDSKKGAKYTRNRRPVSLAYLEKNHDKSTASIRESYIKKLTRKDKLKLIATK
tara:strand:+ start:488 stop:748 length:261 start_codon:yes stop_codon:yes gene_type:complete